MLKIQTQIIGKPIYGFQKKQISIYGNQVAIDVFYNKQLVVFFVDQYSKQLVVKQQATCQKTTSNLLENNKQLVRKQQATCCFYNNLLTCAVRHTSQHPNFILLNKVLNCANHIVTSYMGGGQKGGNPKFYLILVIRTLCT